MMESNSGGLLQNGLIELAQSTLLVHYLAETRIRLSTKVYQGRVRSGGRFTLTLD